MSETVQPATLTESHVDAIITTNRTLVSRNAFLVGEQARLRAALADAQAEAQRLKAGKGKPAQASLSAYLIAGFAVALATAFVGLHAGCDPARSAAYFAVGAAGCIAGLALGLIQWGGE